MHNNYTYISPMLLTIYCSFILIPLRSLIQACASTVECIIAVSFLCTCLHNSSHCSFFVSFPL